MPAVIPYKHPPHRTAQRSTESSVPRHNPRRTIKATRQSSCLDGSSENQGLLNPGPPRILEGRQPRDLSFKKLCAHIPLSWIEQREQLGFSPANTRRSGFDRPWFSELPSKQED